MIHGVQRARGVCVAGVGLCLWTSAVAGAQDTSTSRSGRPASGWATKKEKDTSPYAAIKEKLKQVLSNQQTILQKAETVKTELGIIKVRATGSSRSVTTLATGVPCP